jgi:hypothetical protein
MSQWCLSATFLASSTLPHHLLAHESETPLSEFPYPSLFDSTFALSCRSETSVLSLPPVRILPLHLLCQWPYESAAETRARTVSFAGDVTFGLGCLTWRSAQH